MVVTGKNSFGGIGTNLKNVLKKNVVVKILDCEIS
jgi:hypothetical protein